MIGRLDEAAIKLAEIVNKVLYMYMHTCLLSSLSPSPHLSQSSFLNNTLKPKLF